MSQDNLRSGQLHELSQGINSYYLIDTNGMHSIRTKCLQRYVYTNTLFSQV